jgi:hypothetical protein
MLLRASGDTKETWSGQSGQFYSKSTQGWLDSNNSVGGSGVTTTKEMGDTAGNGYETQVIQTDGYLSGGPSVLFARITGAEGSSGSMPIVEIALDYAAWNAYASSHGLQTIDPSSISTIVFEANRGTKDNANYLWNDKWTQGEEGSPYNINGINQLGNVYELDRVYWERTAVPLPPAVWLLGSGLIGLIGLRRFRK